MRRKLLGALALIAVVVGLWSAAVQTQVVQCGGSFVPSLNCTISGRWYYTNQTTSANTTTQGPIPFQVRDQNSAAVDVTGIVSRVTDLTNASTIALGATPITVVPAPGAGYYVDVIGVQFLFNYTAAYTGGGNLRLWYGTTRANPASETLTASGFMVSVTEDHAWRVLGSPSNTDQPTTNVAVTLQTINGVNFGGGNAANSLRVVVNYRVVRTGL